MAINGSKTEEVWECFCFTSLPIQPSACSHTMLDFLFWLFPWKFFNTLLECMHPGWVATHTTVAILQTGVTRQTWKIVEWGMGSKFCFLLILLLLLTIACNVDENAVRLRFGVSCFCQLLNNLFCNLTLFLVLMSFDCWKCNCWTFIIDL